MDRLSKLPASQRQWTLGVADRVARASSVGAAMKLLETAGVDACAAARGCVYAYDADCGSLWVEGTALHHDDTRGLLGAVARSGRSVVARRLEHAAAYDSSIDDPSGDGTEGCMAVPIIGPDATTHGVLVLVRGARQAAFSADDLARIEALCACVAPMLLHVAAKEDAASEARAGRPSMFRSEAISEFLQQDARGEVVRVLPRWARILEPVLGVLVLATIAALVFLEMDEFAAGPALVELGAREEHVSPAAATLVSVEVKPGASVEAGDVLVKLDAQAERATVDRAQHDVDAHLRQRLLAPRDESAGRALVEARGRLESAKRALERRVVRAHASGIVGDVRVRAGQRVDAGEPLVVVRAPMPEREAIVLLPGDARPRVERGDPMLLELEGFPRTYQRLVITDVGNEIIGPAEVRRALGEAAADIAELSGPVVVARAELPAETFEADHRRYGYFDGMRGRAEVRTRRLPLLVHLLPFLDREEVLSRWPR